MEVAQREYVLTGDEALVTRIRDLRAGILKRVDELESLKAEPFWLELLRTLVPQKFDEIERIVKRRREEGFTSASEELLRNEDAKPMENIRTSVRNLIQEANRGVETRSKVQAQGFRTMLWVGGVLLLLNVALTWYLFTLTEREARRAGEAAAELERRVALRTEELQRSNEDLQQFAYVASHDMKEPMRTIGSYAQLLHRRYEGKLGQDADTYIGFIVDGVKRMNALITDLLDYSRAGQNTAEAVVEVEPEAVLRSVLDNLKITIRESRASVTSASLPTVSYDPIRLAQLLQNLIGNAIKYRHPDRRPEVMVRAERVTGEVVFSVADNGPGIPPEHREEIFGIFKRLHGKEVEGTGIGLAMCKRIVERHGGRIWVESSSAGSTFFFTVPDASRVMQAEA